MKILKKIANKAKDIANNPSVTIAFFGDSITQGCFEVYMKSKNTIETVFDKENAYHSHLAKIFSVLYPNVPVNMINAGISGDNASHALERIERDVLVHNPDLTVVCFGLNDCGDGIAGIEKYKDSLREIFRKLKENNIEIIFMTPNMMNTYVSCHISDEFIKDIANNTAANQNNGILEEYIKSAKEVCKEYDVKVCDCYTKWKILYENGVDTTELLANKLNHPSREMNWLFAFSILETIME